MYRIAFCGCKSTFFFTIDQIFFVLLSQNPLTMKILYRLSGWPLVGIGVAWLLLCLFTPLSNSNTCLLAGLAFIIAGIITMVAKAKRKSPY